jgi:hypothetical protein
MVHNQLLNEKDIHSEEGKAGSLNKGEGIDSSYFEEISSYVPEYFNNKPTCQQF